MRATSAATVVVVEDEDPKFRTVVRILRRLLPGILGVDEVAIARASDLAEAMRVLFMLERDARFVITDWRFPLNSSGPALLGAGMGVIRWCRENEIPFGVISGDYPEAGLDDVWLPWGSSLVVMEAALRRRLRA